MKQKSQFLILFLLLSVGAFAQTFDVGNLRYTVLNGTDVGVQKTGTCPTGVLIIPPTVVNAGTTYTVQSIGDNGFRGCSLISSVIIPNTITSIGLAAFRDCFNLTSVTVNWTTPLSINSSVFSGLTLSQMSLYVPAGSEVSYDAASVWTDFNPIIAQLAAAPTLSAFSSRETCDGLTITAIPFTLGGDVTATLSATDNSATINPTYTFGGSGANRTLTIQTVPGQIGAATISVSATGPGGTAIQTFLLECGIKTVNYNVATTTTVIPSTNNLSGFTFAQNGDVLVGFGNNTGGVSSNCVRRYSSAFALLDANYISTPGQQPQFLHTDFQGNLLFTLGTGIYKYSGQTLTNSITFASPGAGLIETDPVGNIRFVNRQSPPAGYIGSFPANFNNSSVPTTLVGGLNGSGFSDFGLDNQRQNMYYLDIAAGKVFKVSPNGATTTEFVTTPLVRSFAYDAFGTMWLAHGSTGRLSTVDANGVLQTIISSGFAGVQLKFNAAGELYYMTGSGSSNALNKLSLNTVVTYAPCNLCTVPTITATAPAARCDAGAITLSATASNGEVLWYAAPTGGSPIVSSADYTLGLNNNLTINNLTATITFYAEAKDGTCVSVSRTPVVATVNTSTTTSQTTTACDSYIWAENEMTYTASGVYTHTTTNASGCPNVATLNLTINNSSTTSQTTTACDSYIWAENGMTYTATGVYTNTTTNASGCPNVATLNLTINNSLTTSQTITACDSYTWAENGMTYTASGVYTNTTTNASGCPHVATLNLTINNSTSNGNLTITANNTYTWSAPNGSGQTYTTSGIYTHTTTNAAGCPNVATLNLTIIANTFNIGTSCGNTINNLAVTIIAAGVPGASTYTFRVRNMVTNATFVVNRPVNSFALSSYPGITLGTPYQIEVSTNGGANYGAPCLVNTPSPQSTIGAQCGTALTSMGQFVYATYVSSVTGYRFRITNLTSNAVQEYEALAGQNRFTFNQLSAGIRAFGTSYAVEVALRNTDGSYLPYGAGCTISTTAFPTSEIILSQCDTVASSATQTFNAVAVSGATEYRFQLVNSALSYSFSVDRPLNNFSLSMFPGLQPGTTYTVRVAVKLGGVWGPLTGKPCTITTPGTAPEIQRNVVNANDFEAIVYPNPFAESFMFDVKTANESTIQVRVYDMLGKQVENSTVEASGINQVQIGSNYPSGVYQVIVSQGSNTQTLRVIKR